MARQTDTHTRYTNCMHTCLLSDRNTRKTHVSVRRNMKIYFIRTVGCETRIDAKKRTTHTRNTFFLVKQNIDLI